MRIGDYEVQLIDIGRFRLDGGAMFGVVPRTLWERKKSSDDHNRIFMCANSLLIRGNNHVILVDTGIGDKFDEKLSRIYAVELEQFNLHSALAAADVGVEEVTDVILTHLHFDHAGGATLHGDGGNLQPTFPNARYYVQDRQFGWAMQRSEKDRASFMNENFIPLQEHNQLILLDGKSELFPGIDVIPVDGHTIGQQLVLIHGKPHSLLFAGDLIPTAAHIALPWIMSYDLHPLTTLEEKKHYLKLAAENEWLVVFEHDPEIPCGTIASTEKGYQLSSQVDVNTAV